MSGVEEVREVMEVLLSGPQILDKCPVSEPYYSSCWLPIENRIIRKVDYTKTVPSNRNKSILVRMMETKLGRVIDWLRDSGMKVNESKTVLCLFRRGDTTPITLSLYGKSIKSNKLINVLGVIFDSKM